MKVTLVGFSHITLFTKKLFDDKNLSYIFIPHLNVSNNSLECGKVS
jgi:hypothetical protein